MKVAFRVDSSVQIGTGHLARSLRIAEWLKRQGAECVFLCRELDGSAHQKAVEAGFRLLLLPRPTAPLAKHHIDLEHSAWLEVPWQEDAEQSALQIQKIPNLDLLVVDHYALDSRWLEKLAPMARKLMAIDDICDRPLAVDLLMNPSAPLADVKQCKAKPGAGFMAGPAFTLIPEELRKARRLRGESPELRVLLFLGGIDPFRLTGKFIAELEPLLGEAASLDVVIGATNPAKDQLLRQWNGNANIRLHVQPANYLELVVKADIAIGAAGTAAWERAATGLPAILVNFASNQDRVGVTLGESGACVNLGQAANLAPGAVAHEFKRLLLDRKKLAEMSQKGMELVDGFGLERVGQAILGKKPRVAIASDEGSWINAFLPKFISDLKKKGFSISWNHDAEKAEAAEVLCLLSYGKIVPPSLLARYQNSLVVHESDLPRGRGWSPLTWQVIEGKRDIPVCLLEASEQVDAGAVYKKEFIRLQGNELVRDLRDLQAAATFRLLESFLADYPYSVSEGKAQSGEPSYYPRRRPVDSKIDPNKTLKELFPQLQVVDNERYPAYFELNGEKYLLKIEKDEREKK